MEGVDEAFFWIFFIIGLNKEIHMGVKVFNHDNMMVRVVKLVEDKVTAQQQ